MVVASGVRGRTEGTPRDHRASSSDHGMDQKGTTAHVDIMMPDTALRHADKPA